VIVPEVDADVVAAADSIVVAAALSVSVEVESCLRSINASILGFGEPGHGQADEMEAKTKRRMERTGKRPEPFISGGQKAAAVEFEDLI